MVCEHKTFVVEYLELSDDFCGTKVGLTKNVDGNCKLFIFQNDKQEIPVER